MTTDDAALARALHGVIEPIVTTLFLCPEAMDEWEQLGLEPRGQGYVAGRSAPLGAVGPGVAAPLFYNFNPGLVAHALPAAWDVVSPQQVIDARARAVQRTLERCHAPLNDVAEATDLARRAAAGVTMAGRPLAGANAAVPQPVQPFAALWQALCVLREHRGDGHIALLVTAEIAPIPALVLYAAWQDMVSRRFLQRSRLWDDDAWAEAEASLRQRGWLDDGNALTDDGRARRDALEEETDRLAAGPFVALGAEESLRLFDLLVPIVVALNDGGAFKKQVAIPARPVSA